MRVLLEQARGRHDQVLYRPVITHIAGTTAYMNVQRVGDHCFDLAFFNGTELQLLDKHCGGIDKAGSTVHALTAVEGKQDRKRFVEGKKVSCSEDLGGLRS